MRRALVFLTGFSLATLAAVSACSCGARDVVAEVGDVRLRATDVDVFRKRQLARRDNVDASIALEELTKRELLAEAAREAKMTADASLQAEVRAAEREVLARAYLEKALGEAVRDTALRERYDAHRDELKKRTVHVRHIVVRMGRGGASEESRTEATAQTRAIQLYARARTGEDFEALAREESDDVVSAKNGGDLGELKEGQVDATFFEAAAKLKEGEISEPFRTRFGFHILQAVGDPGEHVPSFDEVRGVLAAEARRDREEALMRELRERIAVKVHPERLAGETK